MFKTQDEATTYADERNCARSDDRRAMGYYRVVQSGIEGWPWRVVFETAGPRVSCARFGWDRLSVL